MRAAFRRLWNILTCKHEWNCAHATHYWGEGWLVSYYCTKCGAVKWTMEP